MQEEEAGLREPSEIASPRVVIVTGYSGSGKSTVMHALEDLGFFCIDNLPVPLLPKVVELVTTSGNRPATMFAFVVDTREREFLDRAAETLEVLHAEGARVEVLFLEADAETLLRRFSATRRRHPTSDGGTVRDGIARERELLAELREHADWVIDTSSHTPHTLKGLVQERFWGEELQRMQITLLTFGYKYGLPAEADLVFDLRFLPNPYFVEGMREQTGLQDEVRDYVLAAPEAGGFLQMFRQFAEFALPLYEREGKAYLTVALGCTGGRHRSVCMAEAIAMRLRGRGWDVQLRHRDVEK